MALDEVAYRQAIAHFATDDHVARRFATPAPDLARELASWERISWPQAELP